MKNPSVSKQKKRFQFYFQTHYSEKWWLRNFFVIGFKGGLYTGKSMAMKTVRPGWSFPLNAVYTQWECAGIYVDITVFNIRLGIYLHPIIYNYYEEKH